MQLSKAQQKLNAALAGRPDWQEAFIAVIAANPRKWRQALRKQFACDQNVCGVDNKYLPLIRQIRNGATSFWP